MTRSSGALGFNGRSGACRFVPIDPRRRRRAGDRRVVTVPDRHPHGVLDQGHHGDAYSGVTLKSLVRIPGAVHRPAPQRPAMMSSRSGNMNKTPVVLVTTSLTVATVLTATFLIVTSTRGENTSFASSAGQLDVHTVASGLVHPWSLAFLPDGDAGDRTSRPHAHRHTGRAGFAAAERRA